jgi:hypothetical protein
MYPNVPSPSVVEVRLAMVTSPVPVALDIYPADPNPLTVDCNENTNPAVDTYPNVPSPSVVEVRLVEVTSPLAPDMLDIYPADPNPVTVLTSAAVLK